MTQIEQSLSEIQDREETIIGLRHLREILDHRIAVLELEIDGTTGDIAKAIHLERERCAQVAERYGYKDAAAVIRTGTEPLPDIDGKKEAIRDLECRWDWVEARRMLAPGTGDV
jgi:hypothetical protein